MFRRFADAVVVVTGGGSGIGRATARAFAKQGAHVHVADKHVSRARAVAAELPGQSWAHEVDVRDADAVEALADEVYRLHERTDVLVNNAGVAHASFVHEMKLEDWKWVLDVNLWGVIHGIHAFVPRMIDQGGDAHIVNTASVAGLAATPTMAPYCASKFAVVGISECLGAELAPHGISVSAICPGIVDTDIVRAAKMEGSTAPRKRQVVDFFRRRGMPPERVAADIVRAVKSRRPVQLTAGSLYPALLLKRLSPRLYRTAAASAMRRILAG